MNIQTYQLSLDFEQILNLVRQMPSVEQEKIRQEIDKANREQKLNSFLTDFHTDEISLAEITEEVESVRSDLYLTELQQQLNKSLQQLSPDRLKVLADFAAYLADAESEAATQELLAIPGLLERVKQNKLTPKSNCVNWRTLRSDED
jgi:hypothetical protein